MKRIFIYLLLCSSYVHAQNIVQEISANWQFSKMGANQWHNASVPGTVHTDLLKNKLIPDPFYRDNEKKLQWIDSANWEYRVSFNINDSIFNKKNIDLVFDGLDTYADVLLNEKPVLEADNMFRQWTVNIKPYLVKGKNKLRIIFWSAKMVTAGEAIKILPVVLPDNNRVYARKAQFQFGWDWGPTFIGAGIWKKIWIDAYDYISTLSNIQAERDKLNAAREINTQLVQLPDSGGMSFCFQKNGRPFYAKGANWIPANIFLPELQRKDYKKLLQLAKDANMNMLRVWGGGIYESDDFYDICDSLGIKVWQDFMFAGGMYPGDAHFLENVRQEIKYQIERLRHHPCIILWCGNNEIDEAWHNWGWQQQFNIHGKDSVKIWRDYLDLFNDSLRTWVNEYDCSRPYIESSPLHGWGDEESFHEGDSHYWGLWWGLEDWETFNNKTGRFVSEYGMQSMPSMNTITRYTDITDRNPNSKIIKAHQKASDGFKKLNHYLVRYFIDSAKLSKLSLEDYSYLTQCMQAYILKNSIAIHRSKYPYNMGTLLWQLNDCWPVTSWSIVDHTMQPKAAWYSVKKAYSDEATNITDSIIPKKLLLSKPVFTIEQTSETTFSITSNATAKYVYINLGNATANLSDNYFDMIAGERRELGLKNGKLPDLKLNKPVIRSLYDITGK